MFVKSDLNSLVPASCLLHKSSPWVIPSMYKPADTIHIQMTTKFVSLARFLCRDDPHI